MSRSHKWGSAWIDWKKNEQPDSSCFRGRMKKKCLKNDGELFDCPFVLTSSRGFT